MRMRIAVAAILLVGALAVFIAAGYSQTQSPAASVIADWPETPKKVANQMIEKYGQPDCVCESRLVWQNEPPWREIIVYREEIPHDFPKQHTDLLEQVINYDVPVDKYDEMAEYDGSVICERTKGTMAARCDVEAANFLALNLANDIATDKITVSEAREQYAENIRALMAGRKTPYTSGLQFTVPPAERTGFRDRAVIE